MMPVQRALAVFGMGVREAYRQHGNWFEDEDLDRRWYKCDRCTNIVRETCEKGRRPCDPSRRNR